MFTKICNLSFSSLFLPPSAELGSLILTTQRDNMLTEMKFASGPRLRSWVWVQR